MARKVGKARLTIWYSDDTQETSIHPSRAAAQRIVDNYIEAAVMPYIRAIRIEHPFVEREGTMGTLNRDEAYRIAQAVLGEEADEFDVEAALYWWAADHHEGQGSALYSILSTSPYRPGSFERAPEPDSCAGMLYEALCNEAGCTHRETTR